MPKYGPRCWGSSSFEGDNWKRSSTFLRKNAPLQLTCPPPPCEILVTRLNVWFSRDFQMTSVTSCCRRRLYTRPRRQGFDTSSICCCSGSGRWCWSAPLVPERRCWSTTEWAVCPTTTTWSQTFRSTFTPAPRYCSMSWRDRSRRRPAETTVRRELKTSSTSLMTWTCQRYTTISLSFRSAVFHSHSVFYFSP